MSTIVLNFYIGFEGVNHPQPPPANLYPHAQAGYEVPTPLDPADGTSSVVPLGFDGTGRNYGHQIFNQANDEISAKFNCDKSIQTAKQ